MKIELQVQPTVAAAAAPHPSTNNPNWLKGQSPQQYPFTGPTTTPTLPLLDTISTSIDPLVASQVYQQHQINLHPTFDPLRDPNVIEPYVANAFLNQQYYVPPNIYTSRQYPYYPTVSTYTSPNIFPNWFGSNSNNNNNLYQDQSQQSQRPIIDFLNNIANNNPITNFFNSFGQNSQTDPNQRPFQNFLNNINPLNLFNNNNNNNNRPIVSLPITQGDYIPQGALISPSNNLDMSVFSNDHFLNPNTFYQNPPNPILMNNNYPNYNPSQAYNQKWPIQQHNSYSRPYSSSSHNNRYPTYYNPYQAIYPNTHKKTGTKSKRKKNKNKVDVDTDSDWFQGFLDKRKEASLEGTNSRHTKKDSEEEYDDVLEDYFR